MIKKDLGKETYNSIINLSEPVEIYLFKNEGHGFKDGKIKVDVLKKTEAFFRQYLNLNI